MWQDTLALGVKLVRSLNSSQAFSLSLCPQRFPVELLLLCRAHKNTVLRLWSKNFCLEKDPSPLLVALQLLRFTCHSSDFMHVWLIRDQRLSANVKQSSVCQPASMAAHLWTFLFFFLTLNGNMKTRQHLTPKFNAEFLHYYSKIVWSFIFVLGSGFRLGFRVKERTTHNLHSFRSVELQKPVICIIRWSTGDTPTRLPPSRSMWRTLLGCLLFRCKKLEIMGITGQSSIAAKASVQILSLLS